jgi:hypothetical protein
MKVRYCIIVIILAAGCGEPTGATPSENLPVRGSEVIQTDSVRYAARTSSGEGIWREFGFRVVSTFTNTRPDTIYLGRCFPDSQGPMYAVEVMDSSDYWGAAYDPVWDCVGVDSPIPVPPAATRVDTFDIRGPYVRQGGSVGTPYGVFTGTMRLRLPIQTCPAEIGCLVPLAERVSNQFLVELASP